MKIQFTIPYGTQWGERLLVTGNIPELGNGDYNRALKLNYIGHNRWQAEIEISSKVKSFTYSYVLFNENSGEYKEEWGTTREFFLNSSNGNYACFDYWYDGGSVEGVFMTSPFQRVWFRPAIDETPAGRARKISHRFMVQAPKLGKNEALCILGSEKQLGNWDPANLQPMMRRGDSWIFEVNLKSSATEVYYKYGVYDVLDGSFLRYEHGENRMMPIIENTMVQANDSFVRIDAQSWRAAGVGLPVFSIRTKKSFGVGDFGDLKLLVDWAAHTDLKLIQLLPLNDTIGTHTELDVLPYAAISAFALNPLYLNLPALGELPAKNFMKQQYVPKQAELNARDLVPFMEVISFKLDYAKEVYKHQKEVFLADSGFKEFFKKNSFWLEPYAAFCLLRDRFGNSDYSKWKEHAQYDEKEIKKLTAPKSEHYDEIALHYFMQYHLHVQLHEAGSYANKHNVVLKGDIPIGVNKNSVDTWANPHLFNMQMSAGAPPDMFAVKGQNWSLPTYNWEAMKANDYKWWKQRFEQMSHYFDTFRIDHILGFFRIWQIPTEHVEGIMGHLIPSIPIYINEFEEKGIRFDYNRFCKPYINDHILGEFFGVDASWVKANCLQIEDGWMFRLKAGYQNQSDIIEKIEQGKIAAHLKEPFLDLISNVLFFEVEGSNGTQFYPRYAMHYQRSYHDLDEHTKRGLDELYVHYYYRRQDENWYHSGMEKLPAMKRATNMLICGEDLGMMNPAVTRVMQELGILSLEIQRAPKTNEIEFAHPQYAPYLSVVTPSTHDMTTIRGWWEEDRGLTQRFYNNQLGRGGEAPYFCEWWIARDIVLQHLYSPAMLAVFQLQDLFAISEKLRRENPHEERINDPSNSEASWRYRMHIALEDLMKEDEFNNTLRDYIRGSSR